MKKFLTSTLLFLALSLVLLVAFLEISSWLIGLQDFDNSSTESNTLLIDKDEHYNLLITGISHARVFARDQNHQRIEKILDRSIINIGQGYGGCGMNEQLFYLKYFLKEGNSTDEVLYFLSPPMMYSEQLPVVSKTFINEAFSFDFLFSYLRFPAENKGERIFHYIRSKFHPRWLFEKPAVSPVNNTALTKVDTAAIREGLKVAYGKVMSHERFLMSRSIVEDVIHLCEKNNIRLTFIVPPAVFGDWPGHIEVLDFMHGLQKDHAFAIYDFGSIMLEPEYYYDHHHLNTKGVVYFTENYLKDALGKKQAAAQLRGSK